MSRREKETRRSNEQGFQSQGADLVSDEERAKFCMPLIDGRVKYGVSQRASFDRHGFILLPRFLSRQGLASPCVTNFCFRYKYNRRMQSHLLVQVLRTCVNAWTPSTRKRLAASTVNGLRTSTRCVQGCAICVRYVCVRRPCAPYVCVSV
jgi:hypothetical protein